MSQDRGRELCKHHLDSLVLGTPTASGFARATHGLKQMTLRRFGNQVVEKSKSEICAMAARRIFRKHQTQFIMQPLANSPFGRTV
jgi:hypothetical protein